MDLTIDPNTSLAELQTTLFMAAITELIQLARTTDQDHIKLRALTEVARLCNPAKRAAPSISEPSTPDRQPSKPLLSTRRGGSSGASPTSNTLESPRAVEAHEKAPAHGAGA